MKVYVFGNEYVAVDKRAIEVARELEGTIEGVSFVFVTIQVLVEVILQVVLDVYLVLGRRHDHVVVLDDTSYRIRLKSSRNVMPPAATSGSW
jgi:hypothetical protein